MLSEAQKAFFAEEGYLSVPGVLTTAEVAELRERILGIFTSGRWKLSEFNTHKVLSDVYRYFPEFIPITLNQKVLGVVKDLLGDNPVLMPETAIHHGFYTGWHKDTTTQERMGHTFHYLPEALMIEAGFYLQDNNEWGGGLTVMPGSHKEHDIFHQPRKQRSLVARIKSKLLGYREEEDLSINPYGHRIVDIPSKAGDLVIFNFLLNHRATRPKKGTPEEVPAEITKLAFFNAFSVNNPTADSYLKFLHSREEPFYKALRTSEKDPVLKRFAEENGLKVY